MSKGFDKMESESRKRVAVTPFLKLKAGDVAVIRFITDIDDVEWAYFHTVGGKNRLGDKNFTEDIYCKMQDDERCECCESVELEIRKVKVRMFFHIYVHGILHKEKDADGKWKEILYLGSKYFAEPVNQFKVLKTGPGSQGNVRERIKSWAKRSTDEKHPNGTLTNKVYDWIRQGGGREDTVYDLVPREETFKDLPAEVAAKVSDLIPLALIIKPKEEVGKDVVSTIENAEDVLKRDLENLF